jgi:hypothetical protein
LQSGRSIERSKFKSATRALLPFPVGKFAADQALLAAIPRRENSVSVLQVFASTDLAARIAFIEGFKHNLGPLCTGTPASDVRERPCDHEHDCRDDGEDNYKRGVQNEVYQCAYHASKLARRRQLAARAWKPSRASFVYRTEAKAAHALVTKSASISSTSPFR